MFIRNQMIATSTAARTVARSLASRHAFHTTRPQLSGHHYPEGPLSGLPFNPKKRGFALKFWGFCGAFTSSRWERAFIDLRSATGFGLPFALAGITSVYWTTRCLLLMLYSVANEEEPVERTMVGRSVP